jgi:hypothetical protein
MQNKLRKCLRVCKKFSFSETTKPKFDFSRVLSSKEEVFEYMDSDEYIFKMSNNMTKSLYEPKVLIDFSMYQMSKIISKNFLQNFQTLNFPRLKSFMHDSLFITVQDQIEFLKRNNIVIRHIDTGQSLTQPIFREFHVYHGIDPYQPQNIPSEDIECMTLNFIDATVRIFVNNSGSSNSVTIAQQRSKVKHIHQNFYNMYWKNRPFELPDTFKRFSIEITYAKVIGLLNGDQFLNAIEIAHKFTRAYDFFNTCFETSSQSLLIRDINGIKEKFVTENGLLY